MKREVALGAATLLLGWALPAMAQDKEDAPPPADQAAPAAPAPDGDVAATVAAPNADEVIDVDAIKLPDLAFKPDPEAAKTFDKYYYFNRPGTDFRTALADLRDCDGLSRGLTGPFGNMDVPYPYNMSLAGAAGGVIGNLLVAAIFGSAQVRQARRFNMRRCMFFKGYQRYGLPKDIWQQFNFEEGFSELNETRRQAYLKQQAKVASGPRPQTEVLGR